MFIRGRILFMMGLVIIGHCYASQGGWGGPIVGNADEKAELARAKQAMEDANRAWNEARIAETHAYNKMNATADTADKTAYENRKKMSAEKKDRYDALVIGYQAAYHDVHGCNPTITPIPMPKPPAQPQQPQQVQQAATQNGRSGVDQFIDGLSAAAHLINAVNGAVAPQAAPQVVIVAVPSPALAKALVDHATVQQAIDRIPHDIDEASRQRKAQYDQYEASCEVIRREGSAQLIREKGCSHSALYSKYTALATTLYNKSYVVSDESTAVSNKGTAHYWKS